MLSRLHNRDDSKFHASTIYWKSHSLPSLNTWGVYVCKCACVGSRYAFPMLLQGVRTGTKMKGSEKGRKLCPNKGFFFVQPLGWQTNEWHHCSAFLPITTLLWNASIVHCAGLWIFIKRRHFFVLNETLFEQITESDFNNNYGTVSKGSD